MNIYLDFEATQFKENVLAIGATCNYGSFDCLVHPPKGDKVTNFITDLTGITKEMAENALFAEDAFSDLYYWLFNMNKSAIENNDFSPIFYHVYGNMDKVFLQKTLISLPDNTSPWLVEFIENLSNSLIDDSNKVCKFFHTKAIGVYKALRFFDPETGEQDHDPLNDSIALARVMNFISKAEPLEDCPFEENKRQLPKAEKERTSLLEGCKIKATSTQNKQVKNFNDYNEAFSWIFKKIKKNNPKAFKKTIRKNLRKAILNNTNYNNYTWEKIENELGKEEKYI